MKLARTDFEIACKPILYARLAWILQKNEYPKILYIGPSGYKALESEGMEKRVFGMDVIKHTEEGFSFG